MQQPNMTTRDYASQRGRPCGCNARATSTGDPPWYAHLRPILETYQDKAGIPEDVGDPVEADDYVRGAAYYAGGNR